MLTGRDGQIRLGVLQASPLHVAQIEAWVADFRWGNATVETMTEIDQPTCDLYLIVLDIAVDDAAQLAGAGDTLKRVVAQAGNAPCLVLATRERDAWFEEALMAGASDFLLMPSLDAAQLERAVQLSLGRRQCMDALTARARVLAAARERDQQQLANALHDGPLQDLLGARFLLGALALEGETDDVQGSLQQVMQTIRALCSELKPPALGPFGLEKAIRAHIQLLQSKHPDLAVTSELDADEQTFPEWVRYAFFRIFQAAVANVEAHAEASALWIRLVLTDDVVRLTVADDGQGFVLPSSWLDFASTERYGYLIMQERVDALKGRLVVQSTAGSGTRVMVQVPRSQPLLPVSASTVVSVPDRNG